MGNNLEEILNKMHEPSHEILMMFGDDALISLGSFMQTKYKVANHVVSMMGVHGFPELVKSFITFEILSQISCGKVQNPHIFLHKTVSMFSWFCCYFQDLDQLIKF